MKHRAMRLIGEQQDVKPATLLRILRKSLGYTLQTFSDRSGIDIATLSHLETQPRAIRSASYLTVTHLAKTLNITPEELIQIATQRMVSPPPASPRAPQRASPPPAPEPRAKRKRKRGWKRETSARRRSALILEKFDQEVPRRMHAAGLGGLVANGYLARRGDGYVRTDKPFSIERPVSHKRIEPPTAPASDPEVKR